MHEQVRLGCAALVLKVRMAAFVDFAVQPILAILRRRPAQAHLVVELVTIDPLPMDWISTMNGQEKVFADDRGRRC